MNEKVTTRDEEMMADDGYQQSALKSQSASSKRDWGSFFPPRKPAKLVIVCHKYLLADDHIFGCTRAIGNDELPITSQKMGHICVAAP